MGFTNWRSSEVVTQVVDAFLEVGARTSRTREKLLETELRAELGRLWRDDATVSCSPARAVLEMATACAGPGVLSLKALRRSILSSITSPMALNTLEELDAITGKGGAMEALLRAQEEGLIRGMGFSSHRPPELYLEAIRRIPLSVILIWDNYLEELAVPEIQQQVYPLARDRGAHHGDETAVGVLYRSPEPALRYALGSGSDVLICGMNAVEHVYEAAAAIAKGPADADERHAILRDAPELGTYVCRQCGGCSEALRTLFRLEGYVDRQMIDFLPHDPADYALRLRLAHWFDLTGVAQRRFAEAGWDEASLMAEARGVGCPYGIDVARKAKFALAKLRAEQLNTW